MQPAPDSLDVGQREEGHALPPVDEPEMLTCENDACDRVYDAADGGLTSHPEPLHLCPACREAYTMGWMDHERTTDGRGLRGWVDQLRRRDRTEGHS